MLRTLSLPCLPICIFLSQTRGLGFFILTGLRTVDSFARKFFREEAPKLRGLGVCVSKYSAHLLQALFLDLFL